MSRDAAFIAKMEANRKADERFSWLVTIVAFVALGLFIALLECLVR
jgi:hypothetical protein